MTYVSAILKRASDATMQQLTRQSVRDKLNRYLLNPEHPLGKHKAEWFKQALGYNRANMASLERQIVFDPAKAVQTEITQHGSKFNQTITIHGANGKSIDVVFAWIRGHDDVIKLVTAIPAKK